MNKILASCILSGLIGCVTEPANYQWTGRFAGYATYPGTTIRVEVLNKATLSWELLTTTVASTSPRSFGGKTGYYFSVASPAVITGPASYCRLNSDCELRGASVNLRLREARFGSLMTLDPGDLDAGVALVQAGSSIDYAMAFYHSQETPILTEFVTVPDFYRGLAAHHAPVHYQDTDLDEHQADYVTRVNYDSDWIADNNWNNLYRGDLSAFGYYAVVSTCSHWFITYAFFHPRDWMDSFVYGETEHENDFEGALLVVRRNGTRYGVVEAMLTNAHSEWSSYVPKGSPLVGGDQHPITGTVEFQTYAGSSRAKTTQEAKTHALRAWPDSDFDGTSDGGVVYLPSTSHAEVPSGSTDYSVRYLLVALREGGGLWDRQLDEALLSDEESETFHQWGRFKGNEDGGCGTGIWTCASDAAGAPWIAMKGRALLDPANVVNDYFDNLGAFETRYEHHPYLADLAAAGYDNANLPRGWPEELDLDALYGRTGARCAPVVAETSIAP